MKALLWERRYQDMDACSVVILTLAECDLTNPPVRSAYLCPPCQNCRFKNTYSGSSWSSSSEKQESRWYSSFVLVFPSFTCTHVLTPTQPCCVLHFSPWQQVSKDREDLCAGCPPPAASSPLLLDTFVVKRVVVQSKPDYIPTAINKISLKMILLSHHHLFFLL